MARQQSERKRYPIYDKAMAKYMNLTVYFINNEVPYSTLKRVYEYFKTQDSLRSCKMYLYDSSDTRMISERKKDTIWRRYADCYTEQGMNNIKQLLVELDRPSISIPQFVCFKQGMANNDLSLE